MNLPVRPVLYGTLLAIITALGFVWFAFSLYFSIPYAYKSKPPQNKTILNTHVILSLVATISGPIYILIVVMGWNRFLKIFFLFVYNLSELGLFATVVGLYKFSTIGKRHGLAFAILFVSWAIYLFMTWIISLFFYVIPHHSRHSHRKDRWHVYAVNCQIRNVSMMVFGAFFISLMQISNNTEIAITSYIALALVVLVIEFIIWIRKQSTDSTDDEGVQSSPEGPPQPPKPDPTAQKVSSKKKIKKSKRESSYTYTDSESDNKKKKSFKFN